MTLSSEKILRFFCLSHRVGSQSVAQPRIICERGNHEFEDDFPFSGKWIYCLDCQRFYLGDPEKEKKFPRRNCLACERRIKARFLCPECLTFYIETEKPDKKESLINEDGTTFSVCLACRKNIGGLAKYPHECRVVDAVFYTTNIDCPFCRASIFGEKFLNLNRVVNELESLSYSLNLRLSRIEKQADEPKKTSPDEIDKKLDDVSKMIYRELFKQRETTENQIRQLEDLLNRKMNSVFDSAMPAGCASCNAVIFGKARYCPYCGRRKELPVTENGSRLPDDELKLFPTLVSHILNTVTDKRPLIQYPLIGNALTQPVKSELALFYLIAERIDGRVRNYVVPALSRIVKFSEFNVFSRFYNVERQIFNEDGGKEMLIIKLAEVNWDELIKGFRLEQKGIIKFI